MIDRTGLSRGDRNRNAALARLRVLLPQQNAIVGIDLVGSKQAALVTDHDSRVLARRASRPGRGNSASCWTRPSPGRTQGV